MKQLIKTLLVFTLFTNYASQSYAQGNAKNQLDSGKIEPYRMEVTYDKTSHLIFPSAIRYVDLGSDNLIAGKAESAENVLRVKAATRDFEAETNFSVITDDGRFYNFNVIYNPYPGTLNYDLLKMRKTKGRNAENDILLDELGNDSPSLVKLLLETIYKKDKRVVRHIGSRSFGIRFHLKGIYIHNGKFYFHTELRNNTHLPFNIDFVNFKVADKKIAKRTVIQERPLSPLRIYKPLDQVNGKASGRNVYLLDQLTIADDKVLLIEIFERNGGRHQVLEVENADLVNARLINDLHLKF